ncbi:hypothetical protein LTR86_009405 [Recurvomyces mirabilis]|nr:hypothetical protein LTR86_009405 [Recurvomyces mirabilis]
MSYIEFESLANVLSHCLEIHEHHEISFNFPVTELLPPGVKPHLKLPRDLSYREMPDVSAYLPDPDDLDFFHRLPVSSTISMNGVPRDPHPRCLIASMERLGANQGSSTFDIVGYYEDRVIVHRIRLTTIWKLSGGEVTEVKEFTIDKDELGALFVLTIDEPWMRLLQHLLERASARAYFHVLDRLLKYERMFPEHEERQWRDAWAPPDQYISTAKETFCNHFIRRGVDADGNEIKLPLKSLENLREHAVVWVRPPTCRHKIHIEIASLWHATDGGVLMLAYDEPGCSALCFSEHERKKIELGFKKRRRRQFLAEQRWWALFDFCTEDRYALVEVGDAQMLQALGIALPYMRVPEAVMPGVMSLVDSIAIRAAVAEFEREFGGVQDLAKTKLLGQAHESLIEMAVVAIQAFANKSEMEESKKAGANNDMVAEQEGELLSQHRSHLAAIAGSDVQPPGEDPAAGDRGMRLAPRFERFIMKWTWRAVLFAVASTELAKRQEAANSMSALMKEMESILLS